jgi:hypothetical protein
MSTDFDPYLKWLGIPPEEQPPTHYRLLAIPAYTADPEVIENAADQTMAHLRGVQIGQRAEVAQSLLNQVAMAKVCLLNPTQRAAYDSALKTTSTPPLSPPVQVIAAPPADYRRQSSPLVKGGQTAPRRKSPSAPLGILKHVAASVAGLALGYVILGLISPRSDFLHLFHRADIAEPIPSPKSDQPAIVKENPVVSKKSKPPIERPSPPAAPTSREPMTPKGKTVAVAADPPSVEESETAADKQRRLEVQRDAAMKKGDLTGALTAVDELATLSGQSSLEAKLSFLSALEQESSDAKQAIAEEFVKLLEQAVEGDQKPLAAKPVDRLLVLARMLDNRDLERRATLIALKVN